MAHFAALEPAARSIRLRLGKPGKRWFICTTIAWRIPSVV
jgi:hypothetical protein